MAGQEFIPLFCGNPMVSRFLSPDPIVQSSFAQSFNRYSYVVNNPLKFIDPSGYSRRYGMARTHPDNIPPANHYEGYAAPYYNNNPNSPGYYPSFGGNFSSFGGSIGNPFSIGGGDWVRNFGKMSYQQTKNIQFWSQEGYSTSDQFKWVPHAGIELHRRADGNTIHIQYSGRWISLTGVDRYGDAAKGGGNSWFSPYNLSGTSRLALASISPALGPGGAFLHYPDAVSVSGGVKVITGVGGSEVEGGYIWLLNGPNKGTGSSLTDLGMFAGGVLSASAGITVTEYYYLSGDYSNFGFDNIRDGRFTVYASFGEVLNVGGGASVMGNRGSGYLVGVSYTLSVGVSALPISVDGNWGKTYIK